MDRLLRAFEPRLQGFGEMAGLVEIVRNEYVVTEQRVAPGARDDESQAGRWQTAMLSGRCRVVAATRMLILSIPGTCSPETKHL